MKIQSAWTKPGTALLFGAFSPGALKRGANTLTRSPESKSRQPIKSRRKSCLIIRMDDASRQYISDSIRTIPDFPKKGIMFHDVTTLLLDPKVDNNFALL